MSTAARTRSRRISSSCGVSSSIRSGGQTTYARSFEIVFLITACIASTWPDARFHLPNASVMRSDMSRPTSSEMGNRTEVRSGSETYS
eukprot:3573629-Prymnesium_polylepis.1